jgi:hypothetical protein
VYIQKLHERVNIIPVIAKADSMTRNEIALFKQQIRHVLDASIGFVLLQPLAENDKAFAGRDNALALFCCNHWPKMTKRGEWPLMNAPFFDPPQAPAAGKGDPHIPAIGPEFRQRVPHGMVRYGWRCHALCIARHSMMMCLCWTTWRDSFSGTVYVLRLVSCASQISVGSMALQFSALVVLREIS